MLKCIRIVKDIGKSAEALYFSWDSNDLHGLLPERKDFGRKQVERCQAAGLQHMWLESWRKKHNFVNLFMNKEPREEPSENIVQH